MSVKPYYHKRQQPLVILRKLTLRFPPLREKWRTSK